MNFSSLAKKLRTVLSTLCLGLVACGGSTLPNDGVAFNAQAARNAIRLVEVRLAQSGNDESWTCDNGGAVRVTAPLAESFASREHGGRVYLNCVVDGVVLNGEIQMAGSPDGSVVERSGIISFSGRAEGACMLRESFSVTRGEPGLTLVSSTFCGKPDDARLNDDVR